MNWYQVVEIIDLEFDIARLCLRRGYKEGDVYFAIVAFTFNIDHMAEA